MATQVRIDWPQVACARCDATAAAKNVFLSAHGLTGVVSIEQFNAPDDWYRFEALTRRGGLHRFYLCPDCVNGE